MTTPAPPEGPAFAPHARLTLAGARRAVAAAENAAAARRVSITVAVTDEGGHLLQLSRMDGVHTATIAVAIWKARTAAAFRRPTAVFAEQLAGGAVGLVAMPDLVPFPGGVPLVSGTAVVGAIGVSGAAPQVDEEIARAGAAALATEEKP